MADRQKRKNRPSSRPAKTPANDRSRSNGSATTSGPIDASAGRSPGAPNAAVLESAILGVPIWMAAAVAALLVAIIAGYYVLHSSSATASMFASPIGYAVKDEGRTHVAEGSYIQYQHNPPSSGPHYPAPKDWGFYDQPVAAGYFVHNLEHGGIVVLYDCPNGCANLVTELKQIDQTFPKDKYAEVKMVISPYHPLPNGAQVSVLAWDHEFDFTKGFNRAQLQQFYQQYVDRGPEDIP